MESFGKPESDSDFKGIVASEGNLYIKSQTMKHSRRQISPFSDKTEKLSYEQGDFNTQVEPYGLPLNLNLS